MSVRCYLNSVAESFIVYEGRDLYLGSQFHLKGDHTVLQVRCLFEYMYLLGDDSPILSHYLGYLIKVAHGEHVVEVDHGNLLTSRPAVYHYIILSPDYSLFSFPQEGLELFLGYHLY